MGWKSTGAMCTLPSFVPESAMARTNSKNWVACTSENGIIDFSMSCSWAIFAAK